MSRSPTGVWHYWKIDRHWVVNITSAMRLPMPSVVFFVCFFFLYLSWVFIWTRDTTHISRVQCFHPFFLRTIRCSFLNIFNFSFWCMFTLWHALGSTFTLLILLYCGSCTACIVHFCSLICLNVDLHYSSK